MDANLAGSRHSLRCRCGTIQGVLREPRSANRVICYCKDCQAFAHFLGDASGVLDSRGGSDIIQVLPKNLTFTQGTQALACMRLTPKGLLRWYAGCCRTPIGNTLATPKLSFIGLLHSFLEGPIPLDESVGPVTAWVYTQAAAGNPKPKEAGRGRIAAWFFRAVLKARFNGDYKRTPFFLPDTWAPVANPHVLSSDQLTQLMNAVRTASQPSAT